MDNKERWTIHSWDELREALASMKRRSKLYEMVKTEMTKRNQWKRAYKKREP